MSLKNNSLERSFGIIPIKKENRKDGVSLKEQALFLLVQHQSGHWFFPKGHPIEGERPLQTAFRELKEETGLYVSFLLSSHPFLESYTYQRDGKKIAKTVSYYLAEVEGSLILQKEELKAYQWLPCAEVEDKLTYKEAKQLFVSVQGYISQVVL